jgi:hypothetical protein
MKTILLVSIVLATLLGHPSLSGQPRSDSGGNSVSAAKRQFVLAEIAGFPFAYTHSARWQPYQSIRVGYGRDLCDLLELRVFAEYSQFDFDNSDPMSTYDYSPGRRRDFSIYPAIVAFGLVEIAVGGYNSTST